MQKFNRSQDGGPQKRGQADNRLGERIAHPKNFQRENEHRGQIGIHVFGDDFGPNGSKSSEKGRQKSK